ncbi:MAG: hypothetical protein ACLU37_07370 [Collinsella sp.]
MSPAIDVSGGSECRSDSSPASRREVAQGASGAELRKGNDIASPYRLKMDTLPDYPVSPRAGCTARTCCDASRCGTAAAERLSSWGSIQIPRICAMRLAFVDTQLFDVVMACLSCHREDRPGSCGGGGALALHRPAKCRPLTSRRASCRARWRSGRGRWCAAMIGATAVCGVLWAVVVVS